MKTSGKAPEMLAPPASCRGFTMTELLITVAILPFLSVAVWSFIHAIGNSKVRQEVRLDMGVATGRAIDLWQDDVAMANSIDLENDGSAMTLIRLDDAGQPVQRRYYLARQMFMRETKGESVKTESLVEHVRELSFRRIGSGYALALKLDSKDDDLRVDRSYRGFGAPLTPLSDGTHVP